MFYVKSFRDVFSSFKADSSLFIYHNNNITVVLIYVDDVLVAGNNINFIWGLLEQFELQKILALYIIFSARIKYFDNGTFFAQQKCTHDLFLRTKMLDDNLSAKCLN